MTEPFDYTDWTWEQHLTKACELAALADQFGDNLIPSKAAQRLVDVQQVTARGWLHAKLAQLKKPDTEATVAPSLEPTTAPDSAAAPAAPRRQGKARGA